MHVNVLKMGKLGHSEGSIRGAGRSMFWSDEEVGLRNAFSIVRELKGVEI